MAKKTHNIADSATPVCTCGDDFKTAPCPVHYADIGQSMEPEVRVISDAYLVSTSPIRWEGHVFECPVCQEQSVMHMMKYCGNCGTALAIQSNVVTAHINELQRTAGGNNE